MVLEATLICVDNSEWTRNGDYSVNRFEAQTDAINLICGGKTQQHPENAVGILTMAGDRVDVRVTLTQDLGRALQSICGITINGTADLVRGIQTAQLALKHRMNKNQLQRIVCFVASPVEAPDRQLELLGRQLKKNNVALDIVSIGEVDYNSDKLKKLVQAANSNDSSHLMEVPPGSGRVLSDVLISSPLMTDGDSGGLGAAAAMSGSLGASSNEYGVDPTSDPDLYMALRMSLEEERNRLQREQEASGVGAEASSSDDKTVATTADPAATGSAVAVTGSADATSVGPSGAGTDVSGSGTGEAMSTIMENLRRAVDMSQRRPGGKSDTAESPGEGAMQRSGSPVTSQGPAADLRRILLDLPGVDVNDPGIQEALKSIRSTGGTAPTGDGSSTPTKKPTDEDDTMSDEK